VTFDLTRPRVLSHNMTISLLVRFNIVSSWFRKIRRILGMLTCRYMAR